MSESISRKCWRFAPDGVCFWTQQIFSILRPIYRETAVGSWFSDKLTPWIKQLPKQIAWESVLCWKRLLLLICIGILYLGNVYTPFDEKAIEKISGFCLLVVILNTHYSIGTSFISFSKFPLHISSQGPLISVYKLLYFKICSTVV